MASGSYSSLANWDGSIVTSESSRVLSPTARASPTRPADRASVEAGKHARLQSEPEQPALHGSDAPDTSTGSVRRNMAIADDLEYPDAKHDASSHDGAALPPSSSTQTTEVRTLS